MTTHSADAPQRLLDGAASTATLADVDIAEQLTGRVQRPPDYQLQQGAFAALAKEMAENPRNMLQRLVETALELCHADTAGISVLEGDIFRWVAVAGTFASFRDGTMPRDASPCGVCIDRNRTQLMHLPDRCFPALRAEPRFVEALLIPFRVQNRPIGTVWIVSHQHNKKFDGEDERVVTALTQFASAGWQLWQSSQVAEKSSRNKELFLAALGHELRNPLGAIVNATCLLTPPPSAEVVSAAAGIIARQAARITRLADDILDLARISHGKLALHKTRTQIQSVVSIAVEGARAAIERGDIQLDVHVPSDPVWVEADGARIVQIVSNLLDNAAKFTPPGGRITIAVQVIHDAITIDVKDTGRGIARDQLDGIFNLFEQVEPETSSGRSGLGMGLALVASLTEMHGGSVKAQSDGEGQGSRFTVRLPLC